MAYFRCGGGSSGGAKVYLDGKEVNENMSLVTNYLDIEVSELPYRFHYASAVVRYNQIHILGGYVSPNDRVAHYKWNGSSWTSVSTLPYNFNYGSAVVLNNEIHILGGRDNSTKHCIINMKIYKEVV